MKQTLQAELLAPAGSYESMTAAVNAGADAVYLGGRLFGARAYANNLDEEQMKQAIDYMHLHNKSLYLTVNTLLKEDELEESLYGYLKPLYEQGLDAVIVQDMGVFALIREYFPKLPIHASTQMTITGVPGARMLRELGAERVVTARELSLAEIREIHNVVDIEIESFIHGALCYSYSGQCLFSSIAGGRSGNRGRCAQPCRLPYRCQEAQQYYLSPRDLNTLALLPELLESGVYSLKIEGRMKKPEYTAGVVSVYRKYLDEYLEHGNIRVEKEDQRKLFTIYNRGGFTQGYYKKHNGKDMMFLEGRESEDAPAGREELFCRLRKDYIDTEKKTGIAGRAVLLVNQPALLTLELGEIQVQVSGESVMPAKNQPLDEEKIRRQLEKLGGTPFAWTELTLLTDEQGFLPVTALNELRRRGLETLSAAVLAPYRRQEAKPPAQNRKQDKESHVAVSPDAPFLPALYCYLEHTAYAGALLPMEGIDGLYLDCCAFEPKQLARLGERKAAAGKELFYVLPHIFRRKEEQWLESCYEELLRSGVDGFVVKNCEELSYLKQKGCPLPIRLDYTVYAYNRRSLALYRDYLPIQRYTLPVELNCRELKALSAGESELIVYGRIPMMVSAQCLRQNTAGCSRLPETLTLTDRYRNEFPVKNQCRFCYNKIYNCKPLSLLSRRQEIAALAPGALRLDFTTETAEEAAEIAGCFVDAFKKNGRYMEEPWDFTRGHFKRGIE